MARGKSPIPYHQQQALDTIAVLRQREGAYTPTELLHLEAQVHAQLAVADAIERQTKTMLAIAQTPPPRPALR